MRKIDPGSNKREVFSDHHSRTKGFEHGSQSAKNDKAGAGQNSSKRTEKKKEKDPKKKRSSHGVHHTSGEHSKKPRGSTKEDLDNSTPSQQNLGKGLPGPYGYMDPQMMQHFQQQQNQMMMMMFAGMNPMQLPFYPQPMAGQMNPQLASPQAMNLPQQIGQPMMGGHPMF